MLPCERVMGAQNKSQSNLHALDSKAPNSHISFIVAALLKLL